MPVWGQFRTVRFGFGFGSTMDWTCSEPNLFLSLTIFRYEQVDDAAFMGRGVGCVQADGQVGVHVRVRMRASRLHYYRSHCLRSLNGTIENIYWVWTSR